MAHSLLLADDSQTIHRVVELVLQPEGFDIKSFGNGEDAFNSIGLNKPAIVLADIDMPKLNGYELCRKVKTGGATSHIPVILLAGAFEHYDEDYARSVGVDDVIVKPFESHELISKVNALLLRGARLPEETTAAPYEEPAAVHAAGPAEWAEPQAVELGEPAMTAAAEVPSSSFIESLRQEIEELRKEVKPIIPSGVEVPVLPQEPPAPLPEIATAARAAMEEFKDSFGTPVVPEALPPAYAVPAPVVTEDISRNAADRLLAEHGPRMVEEIVRDSVQYLTGSLKERISGTVEESVRRMVEADLGPVVGDAVRRSVSDAVPGFLEQAVRESVREALASVRNEVNAEVKRVVPEIAEAIIKQEIERISAGL